MSLDLYQPAIMIDKIDWGSAADWFSGTMAACAVGLSLWFSRQSARDQVKREAKMSRLTAMKTAAKLLVIINSIYSLSKHLTDTPVGITPQRLAEGRWRFTLGLEGLTNEGDVAIDPDEFGLLVDGGELQFAMKLSLLARRHSAAVEMLKSYTRRRDDLLERMPAPYEIVGVEAAVVVEGEEAISLVIRSRALESMLTQMIAHSNEDKQMADEVRDAFGPIMRRVLQDPTFPVLGAPASAVTER